MSPTTDIEQRLREAMHGVTPGPWVAEQSMSRKYLDAVLFQYQSGMKGTVALIGKEAAQVGASELDEQNANSAYIALCSPDNIGALLDTIATLRKHVSDAGRDAGTWEDGHRELLNAIMACCDPENRVCGLHPGPERDALEEVISRHHTVHRAQGPFITEALASLKGEADA